jgi:hypothetical protein
MPRSSESVAALAAALAKDHPALDCANLEYGLVEICRQLIVAVLNISAAGRGGKRLALIARRSASHDVWRTPPRNGC